MKFIVKTVFGIVAALALLMGYVFFYTGEMTTVADDYFAAVAENNIIDAKKLLSDLVDEDAPLIVSYLKDNNLDKIQSTSWHSRQFVNNKGSIAGVLTTNEGANISARVDFLKENGSWKIYALAKQSPQAEIKPQPPTMQHQEYLVVNGMGQFMSAAKRKSMQLFHQHISSYWQQQISVAELDQAFGSIYNYQGNLNFLYGIKPVIENSYVDDKNLLFISGYFPLQGSRILIKQKYIYEAAEWRLLSFSYNNENT